MIIEDKNHKEKKLMPEMNKHDERLRKDLAGDVLKKEGPKLNPEMNKHLSPEKANHHLKEHDMDLSHHEKPLPLFQEEMEIMINLSGDKKELIEALNHINHIIIDLPEKVRPELKVRKIK